MDGVVIGERRQYVLFHLGAEEYGLPIKRVQSIIRYEEPTSVPRAPAGVDGVFNLRGQVIPLVDLGRLLLGVPLVPTPAARIIVTEGGVGAVGLAVDAVREVAAFAEDDILPAPAEVLGPETSDAFEGVVSHGERLVILLDPDKALPKPVSASIAARREEASDV